LFDNWEENKPIIADCAMHSKEGKMQNPVENYWKIRLYELKTVLEDNNFEVFLAGSASEARDIVVNTLIPQLLPKSVSWGGSLTFGDTGINEVLGKSAGLTIINPYEPGITAAEAYERRRQALLVDLYFTGANAVTEEGQLVNLDMTGNRVGALNFGPKNVVVVAGRNKIVPSLEEAMMRIKNYAAPTNAMRLEKKTPCVMTSYCEDCKSPERICNVWAITEKSFPKGRIKVVLINQDLGL
jgi:L-lactate utilization protein LutB